MIFSDIQPTSAGLQLVKKKIHIAEKGHKLLKLKRDVLVLELIKITKKAYLLKREVEEGYVLARDTMAIAEGTIGLTIVALSVEETPEVQTGTRNVMGMQLPVFTAKRVKKELATRGYGLIGTSSVIDEAAEAYENLIDLAVRYAEQVAAIQKLTNEIIRLKRRVNALEYRVIPDLYGTRDEIALRKDELEREGLSRIFWVKNQKGSLR
jgi:V/A-type H+/Na+-transporting ATPase subunit D